jgi:6-pyruvoyltetrahydropterin/6-carboxytetrahydropterin synthase
MYNWEISKSFNFSYGHRVWIQQLNHPKLSISTDCKCKNLHGHSGTVVVFVGSDSLDDCQMVTDFKNLKFFQKFLDLVLDHRFIIDINDPNLKLITSFSKDDLDLTNFKNFTFLTDVVELVVSPADNSYDEHLDSFVLVDFVPTSENICKALKHYAQEQLGDVAKVTAVELWETAKSHCRYTGD